MRNTLLLLGWIICVLGQIWARYSTQALLVQSGLNIQSLESPLSTPWASFYTRKGLPQVAYEGRNEVESIYSVITVLSYLTLTV